MSNANGASDPAVASGRAGAYLYACLIAQGKTTITSETIANTLGLNPSQVRRDLAHLLGRTGTRGSGYDRSDLIFRLKRHTSDGAGVIVIASVLKNGGKAPEETAPLPREKLIEALADQARRGAEASLRIDEMLAAERAR